MCEYCGCQEFPAIAQLTSEHDEIRSVARGASLAAKAGDRGAAVVAAQRLLELLEPHTAVEERGLFAAMAGEFSEHVASLESDHRRIEAAFEEIAADREPIAGWVDRLNAGIAELFEHILREQDGLFPAALSVLTPQQWDELDAVRLDVESLRGTLAP